MKTNLILLLLMIMPSKFLLAQQNTTDFITNNYIQSSNLLNTVSALRSYRDSKNLPSYIGLRISEKSAYYKISYQPSGVSTTIWGLVNVRCLNNTGQQSTIEKILDAYYVTLIADDDEDNYTKEIVKNPSVHGGFFFSKESNDIYIYIISHPNQDFVSATIEINGLTVAQKKALAQDFINKTGFQ